MAFTHYENITVLPSIYLEKPGVSFVFIQTAELMNGSYGTQEPRVAIYDKGALSCA